MRFEYPKHGGQPGVLVSPDINEIVAAGGVLPIWKEIAFLVGGEMVGGAIVSLSFIREQEVPGAPTLPLPEDYPVWYKALLPVCEACLLERQG